MRIKTTLVHAGPSVTLTSIAVSSCFLVASAVRAMWCGVVRRGGVCVYVSVCGAFGYSRALTMIRTQSEFIY